MKFFCVVLSVWLNVLEIEAQKVLASLHLLSVLLWFGNNPTARLDCFVIVIAIAAHRGQFYQ